MPRGDGTGPRGQGPQTGKGMGQGKSVRGQGQGAGGGMAAGPGGLCVCPRLRRDSIASGGGAVLYAKMPEMRNCNDA